MAAPTRAQNNVGAAALLANNTNTSAIQFAGNTVAGSLLVCFIDGFDSVGGAIPSLAPEPLSDWNLLNSGGGIRGGRHTFGGVWWKVADGTNPSVAVRNTTGQTVNAVIWAIVEYRHAGAAFWTVDGQAKNEGNEAGFWNGPACAFTAGPRVLLGLLALASSNAAGTGALNTLSGPTISELYDTSGGTESRLIYGDALADTSAGTTQAQHLATANVSYAVGFAASFAPHSASRVSVAPVVV